MKNLVNYENQNLYGACAYAILEAQQSSEPKIKVTLNITQELYDNIISVGAIVNKTK
ncbi:hypothetical protein [Clostridium perfringens]|uniref:hypothetical protein n=1 Tax=Clostridium perfringens TaxID=1502 RepID=UPI0032DBE736